MNYITILLTTSPYSSQLAQDAQNVILSTSAFFQDIKVIFNHQATYQLLNNQEPDVYLYKNFVNTIKSFQWYDIDDIYVTSKSFSSKSNHSAENQIKTDNNQSFKVISFVQASVLIQNSSHCFVY